MLLNIQRHARAALGLSLPHSRIGILVEALILQSHRDLIPSSLSLDDLLLVTSVLVPVRKLLRLIPRMEVRRHQLLDAGSHLRWHFMIKLVRRVYFDNLLCLWHHRLRLPSPFTGMFLDTRGHRGSHDRCHNALLHIVVVAFHLPRASVNLVISCIVTLCVSHVPCIGRGILVSLADQPARSRYRFPGHASTFDSLDDCAAWLRASH